jgi:hypothetical protein
MQGAGPWLAAAVTIAALGFLVALFGLFRQSRRKAAAPKDR